MVIRVLFVTLHRKVLKAVKVNGHRIFAIDRIFAIE